MKARMEAAIQAVQNETYGASYSRDLVRIALAAADAVMFSDEAVERAAKAEHAHDWYGENIPSWENEDRYVKENYREGIRVIIAALKGDA